MLSLPEVMTRGVPQADRNLQRCGGDLLQQLWLVVLDDARLVKGPVLLLR